MTSLASDKTMRDNRLRREGLETDAFPTATFKLTAAGRGARGRPDRDRRRTSP